MAGDTLSLDLRPLFDASARLHGYTVHDWFARYLNHIGSNFQRLAERGYLGTDWQPSVTTDHRLVLDLDALDTEPLTDVVGLYFYVYARHKVTNSRLMGGDPSIPRALYLRGFDYQTDIGVGEGQNRSGTAINLVVPNSWEFTRRLMERLDPGLGLLTSLAPEDVLFARMDAKRYFDRLDLERVQELANDRLSTFYLNAGCWREDLGDVVDRVEHVIVYLSSLTQSSLWELSLLLDKERQRDTTIVFDPEAVERKGSPGGFDKALAGHIGGHVRWPGAAVVDDRMTAAQWHGRLAKDFRIVSLDDFFADMAAVEAHICAGRGPADMTERQRPVPFRFRPASSASTTRDLETYHQQVMGLTRTLARRRSISNLPWYTNLVRLGIFTGLLLGRHDDVGRMAARYSGLMQGLLRWLAAEGASEVVRHSTDVDRVRSMLEDQVAVADQISWVLSSSGDADDFGDHRQIAAAVHEEELGVAVPAIEAFMDARPRGSATGSVPLLFEAGDKSRQ